MYTRVEEVVIRTPELPDAAPTKRKAAAKVRRITTALMGREFMEMPLRHKIYTAYAGLSFVFLFGWFEDSLWLNLLPLLNFANAARLANKIVEKNECSKFS